MPDYKGGPRGVTQPLSGTDGLEGAEDRSHQLPRPPHSLPNKTKANSAAPTSERRESGQRRTVHPAPQGSSRPWLPNGSSRGGGGGGRSSRGFRVWSLPRTQHLERRTAPRLIPMTPPSVNGHSQWRPGPRLGGRPLGGAFPTPFGSAGGFLGLSAETTSPSPETAGVSAQLSGTRSPLRTWSELLPREGNQR